nr:hypothetical protein [Tanacetum cinerariifolium]
RSSKGNEVLQPKSSRNTKSYVRRISKEVVKPKGTPVKSNVGKRKILVEDKEVEADVEGNKSEEADESEKDNESKEAKEIKDDKQSEVDEEVVKDVKTKVVKGKKKVVLSKSKKQNEEVEADVEGNESEAYKSEKDNESENSKESEEDKESEVDEEVVKDVKTKVVKGKGTKGNNKEVVSKEKKRKYVSDSSVEEKVSKPKKVYKKKKQVLKSSSSYEDEKPLKIKKKRSKKKSKKPLTAKLIKKIEYLDDLPSLHSRTVPSSLFAAICDSQVDMESFLLDVSASSYEFKLEKGIIHVTPEKVHEILGVSLSGTSIFDLPEIPLDDPFMKEWFKQFDPKPLKKIRACGIAEKLVLTKTLLYLDSTKFDQFPVIRQRLAIQNWTTTSMNQRHELEIKEQVVEFCSMIKEKISMISVEKIALEYLLKRANAEFPNDEKVIELCEKYRRLFKESVFSEDFQAHIGDFNNNDNDEGGKNDVHGFDNVGKKKESVAKDVVNVEKDGMNPISVVCPQTPQRVVTRSSPNKRIVKPPTYLTSSYINKRKKVTFLIKRFEFVLGNSLFAMQDDKYETVFQTRSGHDLSSVHLNMETLAPRLWIEANVIDCWVAILNHEELVSGCPSPRRHFFPTGCIGLLMKKESGKCSRMRFQLSSKKMFLLFLFPKLICKPVGQGDFGLCKESDDQVSMLNRMRFNIATKILLHEFNVHAEKMFDLAFKFEYENDE